MITLTSGVDLVVISPRSPDPVQPRFEFLIASFHLTRFCTAGTVRAELAARFAAKEAVSKALGLECA